jgi:hypothetical protein
VDKVLEMGTPWQMAAKRLQSGTQQSPAMEPHEVTY